MAARHQYAKALTKGVVKVMSKMGVSTVASYVGSQLFEVVGVSQGVLDRFFPGLASRVGGVTLGHLESAVLELHASAYAPAITRDVYKRMGDKARRGLRAGHSVALAGA